MWHFPRPSIVSELMMPAATVCGLMRLFPAKALARHDRVNLIEDAYGNTTARCIQARPRRWHAMTGLI